MEFLSRFVVTYGGRTKGGSSSSSSSSSGPSPEVESLLHEVGRAIILAWRREGRGGSGGYSEGGVSALPSMFQALDTDHSGYLSIDELKRGLRALPLAPSVSEAALDKLVTHVDADGNGRINLLEFLEAFSVADKASHHRSPLVSGARPSAGDPTAAAAAAAAAAATAGSNGDVHAGVPNGVCDEIIQRALALLFSHKGLLRKCFAHFDEELRGVVSPSDFREALRVFSVACEHDDDAEPLNEQQVDVMAANMNRDADNKVDYEEFLASLRVASLP